MTSHSLARAKHPFAARFADPSLDSARGEWGVYAMDDRDRLVPPGPVEAYDSSVGLIDWIDENFDQFGDIYKASIYSGDAYVIRNLQHVRHVLQRNWQNYTKGLSIKRVELLVGRGLISSEGELWKRQRRLVQPAFHHDVIAGLLPIITDANTKLLKKWERAARQKTSVNITHDLSVMVLELVLRSIFSEDYDQIAPEFGILTEESARDLHFAQAFRPLRTVVARIAGQRRAENRTCADFLGMFMEARDRNSGAAMTDGQLVTEIITLIVAGHETTALTLNWAWHLLGLNAEAEDRLAAEVGALPEDEVPDFEALAQFSYTGQIIDETLRLYPPVWLITRKALHDDRLGDYFVPAKTEIYFSPYLIQRQPDLWKDPDRFDPGRFDPDRSPDRHPLATHPFSAGPRICIGETLARFEMQLNLIIISKRLRLRPTDARPPELAFEVNLRNKPDFIMAPQAKVLRARPRSLDHG
jgi:cytochrome P450